MNSRFIISAAVALAASCIVPIQTEAQQQPNSPPVNLGLNSAQIDHAPREATETMIKEAQAKPTPRLPDGHPDLNGYWTYPQYAKGAHLDSSGNIYIDVPPENGGAKPRTETPLAAQIRKPVDPNPPPYKPELLAKVAELGSSEVHSDPAFHCKPLGTPRAGAPRQILQTAKLTIFLYQVDAGIGDQTSFRLIPTDGRPHRTDVDPSYFGDSIGHWEGDTLVVDATHFNDETWLGGGDSGSGYFHSDALHVVERLTRKGDSLLWEATVEDPNVLTKVWKVTPQTEILTDDMVYEQPICEERESQHIVNRY